MLTHSLRHCYYHPLRSALYIYIHGRVLYAYRIRTHGYTQKDLSTIWRYSFQTEVQKILIFRSASGQTFISPPLILSFPPWTERGMGERGGCDDRCPYSLRENEAHNESGRCVSRGSLPPLLNHWLSPVSVLTLPVLNTTIKTNPVYMS